MTKLMDTVSYFMQMVTFTKENGQRIKQMEKDYILMQMGLSTTDSGETINNMEKEQKLGLMEQYMKVNIVMVKRMVKAS